MSCKAKRIKIICIFVERNGNSFHIYIKYFDVIVLVNIKTGECNYHPSLISACKCLKWMSYSYIKNRKLSCKPFLYKGWWIYRINHSEM